MKSKGTLGKKLLLGFSIAGGILTLAGVPMFIAGGVGTYSFSQSLAPNGNIPKSSGYFNQKYNFDLLTTGSLGNNSFTEEVAKDAGVGYDMIGFAQWYTTSVPNPDLPSNDFIYNNFVTGEDFQNFLNANVVDNAIFITGSVLWPVGVFILLIVGTTYGIIKLKNRNKS